MDRYPVLDARFALGSGIVHMPPAQSAGHDMPPLLRGQSGEIGLLLVHPGDVLRPVARRVLRRQRMKADRRRSSAERQQGGTHVLHRPTSRNPWVGRWCRDRDSVHAGDSGGCRAAARYRRYNLTGVEPTSSGSPSQITRSPMAPGARTPALPPMPLMLAGTEVMAQILPQLSPSAPGMRVSATRLPAYWLRLRGFSIAAALARP